jgi:hypothetical protein
VQKEQYLVKYETKLSHVLIRVNKSNSSKQELTVMKVQTETALVTMPMFMLAMS